LTTLFIKKYETFLPVWAILAAIILGQWIPELPMRITAFEETLIGLPGSLLHTLGIICGFLYWRLKKPYNFLTAFLGCLITVFMFFQGYEYWYHKLNYGTFTGKVQHMLPTKFEAYDARQIYLQIAVFRIRSSCLIFGLRGVGPASRSFRRSRLLTTDTNTTHL
jgi:hypothetical protein